MDLPSSYSPANNDVASRFTVKEPLDAHRDGKFAPPGEGDSRGPCPMLNVLANHGFLPHSGRDVTADQFFHALNSVLNLDPVMAGTLVTGAVSKIGNNDRIAALEDLAKHNVVEHDVSITRCDYLSGQGNNKDLDAALLQELLDSAADKEYLTIQDLAKLRARRFKECKAKADEKNADFVFGPAEAKVAFGEASLILNVMGSQFKDADGIHKVPVSYLKEFFGNERFPEGWKAPEKPLSVTDIMGVAAKVGALGTQAAAN